MNKSQLQIARNKFLILNKLSLVFIILIITLLSVTKGYCQIIEVNSNGLFINSNHVNPESSRDSLLKFLGEPSRKSGNLESGLYNYWIYDESGIRLVFTKSLESINIQFNSTRSNYFPINSFSRELSVFGINIVQDTPPKQIKKNRRIKI